MGVVLFDTNILIDAINSHREAFDELSSWDKGLNVRIPYELETIITTRVINVRPLPT